MKLYDVIYNNDNAEGTALVSAEKAGDIENILRSEGRLNGNIYKVTSIKEVGCSNYPQGVVSEYYGGNVVPEPTPTPPKKDFDIDSMSLEDLSKLKTKLNRADRVLYVDKIISLTPQMDSSGNPKDLNFHPNADVGYSFMNMGRDDSKYKAYHVYVKTKDGYKDLGVPGNYAYVQSAQYRVKISNISTDVKKPLECIKEDIRPLRYGLFLRKKLSRGGRSKGIYYKYIFIDIVGESGYEINQSRWLNSEIRRVLDLQPGELLALKSKLRIGNSDLFGPALINKGVWKEYHGLFILGRVKRVRSNKDRHLSGNHRKYRMVGEPIRYIKARFFIKNKEGEVVERYIRIL